MYRCSWWRHQVETFSALLALCAGNSPVTCEFPSQRPVTRSFYVSLICVCINGWVNNHEAGDLRRHCAHYDVIVMKIFCIDFPGISSHDHAIFCCWSRDILRELQLNTMAADDLGSSVTGSSRAVVTTILDNRIPEIHMISHDMEWFPALLIRLNKRLNKQLATISHVMTLMGSHCKQCNVRWRFSLITYAFPRKAASINYISAAATILHWAPLLYTARKRSRSFIPPPSKSQNTRSVPTSNSSNKAKRKILPSATATTAKPKVCLA